MCGYVGPLVHLGLPKQKRTFRWLDPESRMLLVQSQLDIWSCFQLYLPKLVTNAGSWWSWPISSSPPTPSSCWRPIELWFLEPVNPLSPIWGDPKMNRSRTKNTASFEGCKMHWFIIIWWPFVGVNPPQLQTPNDHITVIVIYSYSWLVIICDKIPSYIVLIKSQSS